MKDYESVMEEKEVLIGFTCDKCQKHFPSDNWVEHQEMHTICFVGGYGSVFGDESYVDCDLCQECLHGLIKDFVRIS